MEEQAHDGTRDPSSPKDQKHLWLAYELHDGLLQWIVGARMQIEVALDRIHDADDCRNEKRLQGALGYLESALDEGKELIAFLEQASESASSDLEAAVQSFLDSVEPELAANEQQAVFLPALPVWPDLSHQVTWNLLRLTQQAIRNAIQHAGKTQVVVRAGWQGDRTLRLEIRDQGSGFDLAQHKLASTGGLHFGLSSMQHRAKLVGGTLEIQSSVGQGCGVILTLPAPAH